MADSLYKVLGVSKSASEDEIRKAYRKLAKDNHPDLHPGDKAAEDRFKRISAAFGILGDADKRKRYDRGEIDESGQERQPQWSYRQYADGPQGRGYQSDAGFADIGDIFSDLFGGGFTSRGGRGGGSARMRGSDVRYRLAIDFVESIKGAKKRVTMPDGKALDITIPPGLRDGQTLRLKGKGEAGFGGGPAGDALVEVSVTPHPFYVRDGDHVRVEVPVTLDEAVLGGKIRVPTPGGPVDLTVPKGSNTGSVLRLKGRGAPNPDTKVKGDLFVTLKVTLPETIDPELETLVSEWRKSHGYQVRRKLGV